MSPPVIEFHEVSKRFGARWALRNISLTVPVSEVLLLTGHNGSGKTTLLRLMATAIAPNRGRIGILGSDARRDRDLIRRNVGLLSHANYLYEDLSAAQNLRVLATLLLVADPSRVVKELLERVGLADRSMQSVREFSAGMRKRLAVARLLLKRPRIALLDEPFGELDPQGIEDMEAIVNELKASGVTIILATHLVPQGLRLASRRIHLDSGCLSTPLASQ